MQARHEKRTSKLSQSNIEHAAPEAKPYRLWDTKVPGLFLRVQPSGVKSWNVQWAHQTSKSLGKYPVVTLEGARVRARALLGEVDKEGAPKAVIAKRDATGKPGTFGEFMREHYAPDVEATAKAGKETTALIKKHFGYLYGQPMQSITPDVFDKFKAKRVRADIAPATINRDLGRLKAALSKAVQWKMLAANPLDSVKPATRGIEKRVRYLAPGEAKALRKALAARDAKAVKGNGKQRRHYSDHLTPMALLALNTGLRRGELTSLTWEDVDLAAKRLTVRAGYAKSGKARHVPLNSEALAVLKQWKKHRPDGRLFAVTSIKKAWNKLMEDAAIENLRFHDLRHDFASKLVMAGVDLNTVRELLGHGSLVMTLRYAHLAPEHKAAAVELLKVKK